MNWIQIYFAIYLFSAGLMYFALDGKSMMRAKTWKFTTFILELILLSPVIGRVFGWW